MFNKMLIIVIFILSIAFLSCIIPLIQYITSRIREANNSKERPIYTFSKSLLDYNMKSDNSSQSVDRFTLANRGWVRCPHGRILNNEDFSKKKAEEYSIMLPHKE